MQAVRVRQEVAVRAERVAIDLAGVKVNQPIRVGVLELQNGFLDFSGRSADLDGDSVVDSRGVGLAVFLSRGKGDFGAARGLVTGVEVYGEGAVVDDVRVSKGGVRDVCC